MPHSQYDENTVLDLLQELHTLFHSEVLSTLLQVQKQGEQQKSGTAAEDRGCPQALGRRDSGPTAAVLRQDRLPGCTQERLALQLLLLSRCVSGLPTALPAGLQHIWE